MPVCSQCKGTTQVTMVIGDQWWCKKCVYWAEHPDAKDPQLRPPRGKTQTETLFNPREFDADPRR